MVHHDIFSVPSAQRVTLVVSSYPDIANNDIIGVNAEIAFDCDSISGCGLSGDCDVIILDPDISIDRPCNLEDDDSRPLGLARIAKTARTRRI